MNNPFSKTGGIMGIFALFRTVLIKDQKALLDVSRFAKVGPVFRSNFVLHPQSFVHLQKPTVPQIVFKNMFF